MTSILPESAEARKRIPLAQGLLYYFPDALIGVAELSRIGNEQHNPGQPLHWARGKSNDHADCILRHQLDVGTDDVDGVPHSIKVAWRALAQAQLDLEARKGAKPPRNARLAAPGPDEPQIAIPTREQILASMSEAAGEDDEMPLNNGSVMLPRTATI